MSRRGLMSRRTLSWSDVVSVTYEPGGFSRGYRIPSRVVLRGRSGSITLSSRLSDFAELEKALDYHLWRRDLDYAAAKQAGLATWRGTIVAPYAQDLLEILLFVGVLLASLFALAQWR